MKPRREGTLAQFETDDIDELSKVQAASICGLADFITKARDLAHLMADAPARSLRRQRALSLLQDLDRLDAAISRDVDEAALYDAIGAALTFSNLRHEGQDDSKARGKITRRRYLQLKAQGLLDKQIAAMMNVTPAKLSEWKRRHLRE